MNVWIEAPFDSLPTEGYRKQRYWLMAEAFVRAGHHVVYWTSDFSHARKERRRAEAKANGGFEIRFVPTRPYEKNVSWARVRSHRAYAADWERVAIDFVKQPCDAPDLIVVSAPPVSTGPVALRLARRFGARLVVDVQDAWPETFYRLLPRGFRWIAWLLLSGLRRTMRRVYRQADLVTGVCDRYAALVKGYGAKGYYRAYLGIELPVPVQVPVSGEGVRLAYAGNMGKSYDLKTVVEGVALLRQEGVAATLDVAGFGGTVEENEFVRFHGMLKEDELRQLLASCDIGVIPMTEDSFVGVPNKLAEYADAGLRIVSSLAGESADLLARYGCGVAYRAGDAASFAAAVREAKGLSPDASRRLVKEEFAAETIYDAYCRRVTAGRKISLITACYNAEKTIADAMKSVLTQRHGDTEIEYIVVDGGSTDGTVREIENFANEVKAKSEVEQRSFSFKWISEKDRGLYDALNKGIATATGDVIGILNADDVLAGDDVLEKVARGFQVSGFRRKVSGFSFQDGGEIDAVYGDIRFVREDFLTQRHRDTESELRALRELPTVRYCTGKWFRPWMFRFGTQPAHPSVFFRRECFEKWGGYSLDYGMYGDFELLCRFIWKNRARMGYLPMCTTVMRMGGASTDGWRTTLRINRSDLRALRANGCWSCLPLIYLKYAFKVWGFVFRHR